MEMQGGGPGTTASTSHLVSRRQAGETCILRAWGPGPQRPELKVSPTANPGRTWRGSHSGRGTENGFERGGISITAVDSPGRASLPLSPTHTHSAGCFEVSLAGLSSCALLVARTLEVWCRHPKETKVFSSGESKPCWIGEPQQVHPMWTHADVMMRPRLRPEVPPLTLSR